MPTLPAAREGDDHVCGETTQKVPHVGGPIVPPCEPTVLVNGKFHARLTDKARCNGPIDEIVTGAATVFVGGEKAGRMTEKTLHVGGEILPLCSPDVFIGGPSAGKLSGAPGDANDACKSGSGGGGSSGNAGNTVGDPARDAAHCTPEVQQGNNCGPSAAAEVASQYTGNQITKHDMTKLALQNKLSWTSRNSDGTIDYTSSGMTFPWKLDNVLELVNVPASTSYQTFAGIEQALADGKGVITMHYCGRLTGGRGGGLHYVRTTGIKYGPDGEPTDVIINNSGWAECSQSIPVDQYKKSLPFFGMMVTTDSPMPTP